MHITPWSIYDRPFHKPSKPPAANNIESPKLPKHPLPTTKKQTTSPKSKPQQFYSYSIMKPLEKQMNLQLALKCIHSTLEEPSLNCISLPKISNPLVRHKSNSLQHKGKNKIKKIKVKQANWHKHKTVDHQLKNPEQPQLFDQCPFNDEKLVKYRHPQTHRNIIKFKLDALVSPI